MHTGSPGSRSRRERSSKIRRRPAACASMRPSWGGLGFRVPGFRIQLVAFRDPAILVQVLSLGLQVCRLWGFHDFGVAAQGLRVLGFSCLWFRVSGLGSAWARSIRVEPSRFKGFQCFRDAELPPFHDFGVAAQGLRVLGFSCLWFRVSGLGSAWARSIRVEPSRFKGFQCFRDAELPPWRQVLFCETVSVCGACGRLSHVMLQGETDAVGISTSGSLYVTITQRVHILY